MQFLWLHAGLPSFIIQCCVRQWWVLGKISRNFEFWKAALVYEGANENARNLRSTVLVIAQCSQCSRRCILHIKWLPEIRRSYLRCKSPTRSFNWEVSLSFSSSSCETFNRRQEKRNCVSKNVYSIYFTTTFFNALLILDSHESTSISLSR